ncbi:hypothetical protein GDN83_06955 [Gordonia jinghuaiqii]|uniref:Uncharacterized protein n=1 Tax=Gordonia jinghuaiqii TaxID=2758710 RepID=A0A7D7R0Q7_9ACTN|nr:hypothetical protein [Gordonia jinghuaiqii]MCR5977480.1 hypothetical protein [Gordonia jinghuaiqii]QMT02171.1 hypothetical protein H1R19_03035 [Gordonia jinghuaiqii]
MTFVIAKIVDHHAGRVMLLADTKMTHRNDEKLTRHALVNPLQKVVIVNDNVAVGFAGDNPENAIRAVVDLRGNTVNDIKTGLLDYTRSKATVKDASTSFLLTTRGPAPQIVEISNGIVEDRTAVGTGWIGDADAHRAYTKTFLDLQHMPDLGGRFVGAMASVVTREEVASVGGHMVRATGCSETPMRFHGDPGFVMPWSMAASLTALAPGQVNMKFSLPKGHDPTRNSRIPVAGKWPTFSALAHFVPELNTAWLHTHEQPWQAPIRIEASSVSDLGDIAKSEYRQLLDTDRAATILEKNLGDRS